MRDLHGLVNHVFIIEQRHGDIFPSQVSASTGQRRLSLIIVSDHRSGAPGNALIHRAPIAFEHFDLIQIDLIQVMVAPDERIGGTFEERAARDRDGVQLDGAPVSRINVSRINVSRINVSRINVSRINLGVVMAVNVARTN